MPPKNNKRASVVERKAVKFLITDRPHPDTVEMYLKVRSTNLLWSPKFSLQSYKVAAARNPERSVID